MTVADLSPARELPASPASSHFRRSGSALALMALAGPSWNVILVGLPGASVTAGRALIVIAVVLLALDARRAPRPLPSPPRAVWLLLAALTGLWGWAAVNALAWGCRCASDLAGLAELVAVVALVALAATFEPRLRPALLLAIVAGAALTALMTLAGVHGLSAGTRNPFPELDRLSGPYGNPNFLAFALAFAIPVMLVSCRMCGPRARLLLRGALVLVGVVLLLTFSRGALLAAAAGGALVLVLIRPAASRSRWRMAGALVAAAIVAALAYPLFAEQRREASSATLAVELAAQDRSGWDAGTQGLVPTGPARMTNPAPNVLAVGADAPGRGVSRPLGPARAGGAYEVRFEARAASGVQRVRFGLEDNKLGNGPVHTAATLDRAWRAFRLRWRPTADSPSARLYIWTTHAGAGFQVRSVLSIARVPGEPTVTEAISPVLLGSRAGELRAERVRRDARDVRTRRVGAELSLDAFASQPLRGIGWGRFVEYSSVHSEFRRLPTHNEYLRILAELGMLGVALLAMAGAAIASAFWRRRLDAMGIALLGVLTTGAAGLVFVNALTVVAIAAPLGMAAAIACARAGPRLQAEPAEATAWWSAAHEHEGRLREEWDVVRGWVAGRGDEPGGRSPAVRLLDAIREPGALPATRSVRLAAAGIGELRGAAPAPVPEGWSSWLRHSERELRRVARGAGAALRHEGGRALALRGAVARGIGPRAAWAAGVGAVALAMRLPLMLERHAIAPGGDSEEYALLARTFFDQGPVSLVRPPGYPLFLALADLFPGRFEDVAVIAQLLLGAGLCGALVMVAWPLFGRLAAVVAGLLLALTAPFVSIESLLLADMLFGLLVTIAAGLIAAAALADQRRLLWLVGAGVAIASAAYVKPVGHALVLAPLLALALATRSWRATLLGAGAVAGVVALLTVPWMARNDARYGSFTMSAQTGQTLFNRVFERDNVTIPTDLAVGRLAARQRREHPDERLSSSVAQQLVLGGDTYVEAQAKMREVAVTAARREPGKVAAGALRSTHNVFDDVASGQGEDTIAAFVTHGELPAATRLALGASKPLLTLWRALAVFGFAALLWLMSRSRRTRVAAGAAIGAWGTVAVATAVLHGGQARYSASLAPLTFLLGSAGVVVAVKVALQLLGVGTGAPCPPLVALVRNAVTPSGAATDESRRPAP